MVSGPPPGRSPARVPARMFIESKTASDGSPPPHPPPHPQTHADIATDDASIDACYRLIDTAGSGVSDARQLSEFMRSAGLKSSDAATTAFVGWMTACGAPECAPFATHASCAICADLRTRNLRPATSGALQRSSVGATGAQSRARASSGTLVAGVSRDCGGPSRTQFSKFGRPRRSRAHLKNRMRYIVSFARTHSAASPSPAVALPSSPQDHLRAEHTTTPTVLTRAPRRAAPHSRVRCRSQNPRTTTLARRASRRPTARPTRTYSTCAFPVTARTTRTPRP